MLKRDGICRKKCFPAALSARLNYVRFAVQLTYLRQSKPNSLFQYWCRRLFDGRFFTHIRVMDGGISG
jgi:hypothetical protein